MANVSVSELVLFIAAITVAAGVATTLTASVSDISHVVTERGDGVADSIATEVEVINDPGSPSSIYNSSTDNVTLLVKNTGGEPIPAEPDHVEVLVDGNYTTVESVTVIDAPDWGEGDVAKVVVTQSLSSGEHRVTVIVNQDEELLRFRI